VGTGLAVTLPSATGSAIISPYGTVDTVKSDFEGPCQSRLRVRARALPLDKLSGSIRKRDRALLSALRESRPSDPCWISIFPSATRSSPSRPVPPAPLELPIIFVGAVHRARLDQVDKPTRYECRSRLSPAARPAYRSFPPPSSPPLFSGDSPRDEPRPGLQCSRRKERHRVSAIHYSAPISSRLEHVGFRRERARIRASPRACVNRDIVSR